ncbi:hypothetical protein MTO96_016027 [Rhipicephalus appendiculatus]
MRINTTKSSTGPTIVKVRELSGVYVWIITAGIVTGALLLGLVVWLVVFRLRRSKRNSDSAEPPLLTREPWHRKSIYSWSDDEDATVPRCTNGRLWFSLNYKSESGELNVNIIKAKYLPGRGLTNTPRDPFVRAYLLPDEDTFQQSTVKTRTLAPKFNETLTFKISEDEVRARSLRLSVYDIDRKKVRHCLGHVTLQLEKEPLAPDKVIWMDLDNVPKKSSQIGEIQICMTCNPFTNRIRASILKVRKFSKQEDASKWVYVKLSLNHGRKCVKEKRSENREWGNGDEANFGDAFTFGVAGRYFDSCSLSFTVMVSPDGADFRRLGKTVLGPFMYARGEELRHWQDMLTNPRSAVTRWHALECPTGRDEWKSD